MPLCTIHLLSLAPPHTIASLVPLLRPLNPLVMSKVIRWIILPETIDVSPLLHPPSPWHMLLIVPGNAPLPAPVTAALAFHWSIVTGIPSRLTKDFASTNAHLLHPAPGTVPALTGALDKPRLAASSQTLELSPGLNSWIAEFARTNPGAGAVSMLNLLAFKPGMHESYLTYGRAFADSIGSRRGGNAKLVGNIVHPASSPPSQELRWDEFALAHYPTIRHFADMLASEDYQAVNLKYRVPALRDTCILCTSEIAFEDEVVAGKGARL